MFAGSSVGLTIPASDVARFEEVLKEFTAFQVFNNCIINIVLKIIIYAVLLGYASPTLS